MTVVEEEVPYRRRWDPRFAAGAAFLPDTEPEAHRCYLNSSHVVHIVTAEVVDGRKWLRAGSICGKMLNEKSPRWMGLEDAVEWEVAWRLPLCSLCRTSWRQKYGPISIKRLLSKAER